jgi:hypothetical protein
MNNYIFIETRKAIDHINPTHKDHLVSIIHTQDTINILIGFFQIKGNFRIDRGPYIMVTGGIGHFDPIVIGTALDTVDGPILAFGIGFTHMHDAITFHCNGHMT